MARQVECVPPSKLQPCFEQSSRVAFFFEIQVSIRAVQEAFLRDCSIRRLKVMPGLTAIHLVPNSFEKMRVSLAYQLFGTSVLRGMTYYKAEIERICGSIIATQEFFV